MNMHATVLAPSPYASAGQKLVDMGYAAIPILPGEKRPGEYRNGKWRGMIDWGRYASRLPSDYEIPTWSIWPDAGIGIAFGPASHDLVAVDIDTDDHLVINAIRASLPVTTIKKKGLKGETWLYRGPGIMSKSFNDAQGHRLCDLLGPGRQSVMPPSLHATTGQPYRWTGPDALDDVAPTELPVLPVNAAELIGAALAPFGYKAEPDQEGHQVSGSSVGNDTPFRALNQEALTRLKDWIPQLGLYGCKRRGQGYAAVATWRPSSTGRPPEVRKLNLGIQPNGICDFGDRRTYTALDLVVAARGENFDRAHEWLARALGKLPDKSIKLEARPERVADAQSRVAGLSDWAPDGQEAEKVSGTPPPDIDELEAVCAANLAGKAAPPRRWIVDTYIPDSTVSLFMGDGATGKSLIALQLAVAMDSGSDWLRLPVCGGPVVFLTAEDDLPEVHRRLEAVCFELNVDLAQLTGLFIPTMAGKDAVLANFNGRNGAMEPTPIWRKLEKLVTRVRPKVVILDTLADIFGGDEISRRQTRSFVGLCRGMAIERDCGVLLLGHPSVSGMITGAGTSGSTAWSNSVRSRLYIERVIQERVEMDPNVRVITGKKANYGPVGNQIRVRWNNWCFTREDGNTIGGGPAGGAVVDSIFLEILGLYETQGREVSPNKSSSYAPKMFAEHERAKASNLTTKALSAAMDRLLEAEAIKIVQFGPPSKRRSKLVTAPIFSNSEGGD